MKDLSSSLSLTEVVFFIFLYELKKNEEYYKIQALMFAAFLFLDSTLGLIKVVSTVFW